MTLITFNIEISFLHNLLILLLQHRVNLFFLKKQIYFFSIFSIQNKKGCHFRQPFTQLIKYILINLDFALNLLIYHLHTL